jgi:D-alanine-D-alanine ligase
MLKKKVALFFGGRSGEHVVSLRSAESIMQAIDGNRYEIIQVGITREGVWYCGPDCWQALWKKQLPQLGNLAIPSTDHSLPGLMVQDSINSEKWHYQQVDIAFPILHGPYGEDGTIQGLFEMANLPYVGSGVLSSSTAMDKVVMKLLFQQNGLPVAPFVFFYRHQWAENHGSWLIRVKQHLGFPCFVKPSNLGSSVGISKCKTEKNLNDAVEEALQYDDKVVIEKYIPGRELECSVLGDVDAEASRPGELIPSSEFYDYSAKYLDGHTELIIPAKLDKEIEKQVRDYSVLAFHAVEASGMARVDFFLTPEGKVIVNEINTLPGFTSISMYPKLWDASGLPYRDLISRLIKLAEQRFKHRGLLLVKPPE